MLKQVENRKRTKQKVQQKITVVVTGPCRQGQTNPLFIEEILENVFTNLVEAEGVLFIGKYRTVCKIWDKEIFKMIRHQTQINIKNILRPYPYGLEWTAQKDNSFQYRVPYPEVRLFENVKLSFNSGKPFSVETKLLEKWFNVMGCQLKGICFESTLLESHREVFTILENVLKKWCPNLQCLTLNGVKFFSSLILHCGFTDSAVICKGLKDVNICVRTNEIWDRDRFEYISNTSTKVETFNKFIYEHGLPGSSQEFPEITNHSGLKITVPKELFLKSEFPDISQFIPENFFPKGCDGGILGQLISCTSVEKLRLKGEIRPFYFKHFVAFCHYRKNLWKKSMHYLELDLHDLRNSVDLIVLSVLKYPIVTLKLKQNNQQYTRSEEIMTRFFSNFADTLNHLEFNGNLSILRIREPYLLLPFMPVLKSLVYQNQFTCQLCPINIMTNLPNLSQLCLNINTGNKRGGTNRFFTTQTDSLTHNQLKELKVTGILSGLRARKLLKWFPKVTNVELAIWDTDNELSKFLKEIEFSDIEHLKLSWSRTIGHHICTKSNTALMLEVGKLKNLRSLDLTYLHGGLPFFVFQTAFSEGFATLTNLQILSLNNFGVYRDDETEITKCIAHVPIVSSNVMLSRMRK